MAHSDNTQTRSNPVYRGIVVWGIIALACSALIAAILLFSSFHLKSSLKQHTADLNTMRQKYESAPHSATLAQNIRELDTRVRRDALRTLKFNQTGKKYFAYGLAAAFLCLAAAQLMLRPEPKMQKQQPCAGDSILLAKRTRIAVAAVTAVIAAAGLFLVFYEW